MKHQPMIPTVVRANDCFTIISKTAEKEKKNDREKEKKLIEIVEENQRAI